MIERLLRWYQAQRLVGAMRPWLLQPAARIAEHLVESEPTAFPIASIVCLVFQRPDGTTFFKPTMAAHEPLGGTFQGQIFSAVADAIPDYIRTELTRAAGQH